MSQKLSRIIRRRPYIGIAIYWTVGIIIFFTTLSLFGCAPKTKIVTQYREVKIPVKCEFQHPVKPLRTGEIVIDIANTLKYTEELEATLRRCE